MRRERGRPVTYTFRTEERFLESMARQFRFAAANTINESLFAGRGTAIGAMQVFDRPTQFTLRSPRVEKATRDNLVGAVLIPTEAGVEGQAGLPAGKPLLAEVHGGQRRFKRSEVLLQRLGLLPRGWFTVPGPAAELDAYGNMTRAELLHLLSYFKAYGGTARSGKRLLNNMSDEGRAKLKSGRGRFAGGFATEYFAQLPGDKGLRPGIYVRKGATQRRKFQGPAQRVRAVLFFVSSAQYQRLYDFGAGVDQGVSAVWNAGRFHAHLDRALATARV